MSSSTKTWLGSGWDLKSSIIDTGDYSTIGDYSTTGTYNPTITTTDGTSIIYTDQPSWSGDVPPSYADQTTFTVTGYYNSTIALPITITRDEISRGFRIRFEHRELFLSDIFLTADKCATFLLTELRNFIIYASDASHNGDWVLPTLIKKFTELLIYTKPTSKEMLTYLSRESDKDARELLKTALRNIFKIERTPLEQASVA